MNTTDQALRFVPVSPMVPPMHSILSGGGRGPVGSVADALPVPVWVLGSGGGVALANGAAREATQRGKWVRVEDQRLLPVQGEARAALERALRGGDGGLALVALDIEADTGGPVLLVSHGAAAAVAVCVLFDPGESFSGVAPLLQGLWGVDPHLAQAAQGVAGGLTCPQASKRLKIKPNSAQQYVKEARARLGARSQPALVRRLWQLLLCQTAMAVAQALMGLDPHDVPLGPEGAGAAAGDNGSAAEAPPLASVTAQASPAGDAPGNGQVEEKAPSAGGARGKRLAPGKKRRGNV